MPTIVMLGKVKVQVFADDHNPPHFHITTPDHEALVSISSLAVLRGSVSRRDLEAVIAWISEEKNRKEIEDAWDRLNDR